MNRIERLEQLIYHFVSLLETTQDGDTKRNVQSMISALSAEYVREVSDL